MNVELILKQPIEGLGAESDVVKVKSGYARNYLLPNHLAVIATKASKKQIEDLKRRRAEREAEELNNAQELASKINKMTLTFQMETSDDAGEKVFGSVTAADVADRLQKQSLLVPKKKIQIGRPLKEIGEHSVVIHLGAGVDAKLKVVLVTASAEKKDAKK